MPAKIEKSGGFGSQISNSSQILLLATDHFCIRQLGLFCIFQNLTNQPYEKENSFIPSLSRRGLPLSFSSEKIHIQANRSLKDRSGRNRAGQSQAKPGHGGQDLQLCGARLSGS